MSVRGLTRLAFAFALAGATSSLVFSEEYTVDPVHSSVGFRVKHLNTSYATGRFDAISGTFAIHESDPAKSNLHVVIKAESIDTNSTARDEHLKKDFFQAAQHPNITFKSKSFASAGPHMFEVMGDLTLHGVTRPVTLKLEHVGSGKDMKGKAIVGVAGEFKIKRSDFGMNTMVGPIGDEVKVEVSLEGAAK